jgi:plasmid stability protein
MDDWVIAELKAQARAHGRSLEAELRDRLRELAIRPRQEMADRAARLRDAIAQEHGLLPSSSRRGLNGPESSSGRQLVS